MKLRHDFRRSLVVGWLAVPLLAAGAVSTRAEIIGAGASESFSVCEEATDNTGAPRRECQGSDLRFQASTDGESEFGFALASGHLNGDAYEDLVVGDPGRNRVFVFFGRPSLVVSYALDPQVVADRMVNAETQADLILAADPAAIGAFGFSVKIGSQTLPGTCAPDDRAFPLIIGAPGRPGVGYGAPGSVLYVRGGELCMPASDPASTTVLDALDVGQLIRSPIIEDDDEFGYSLAFGRVLTNTGNLEDVIVGARMASGGAGKVVAFPVSDGTVSTGVGDVVEISGGAGEGLGEVIAVGDLDLDFDAVLVPLGAADDVAIGAVGNARGKVMLVEGPLSPDGGPGGDGRFDESDERISTLVGEAPGEFFGFSLATSREGRLAVGAIYAKNVPSTAGGNAATNVGTVTRNRAGKTYVWNPGILPADAPESSASTANQVLVAHRSTDQLGFAVGFADLDDSGHDDLIVTARREDGRGLAVNHIDRGTTYVAFDSTSLDSPVDLGLCAVNSDCTGVSGIDVMIFGGDRGGDLGDESGFSLATGDFNGDGTLDLFLSSVVHRRVYAVTLLDTDGDRLQQGRNLRDDDDDGDGDVDAADCQPLDAAIHTNADEIPCNIIDENCNGNADNVPDNDHDASDACTSPGAAADCNDADPLSFPGAPEVCDGNDNDCSGSIPAQERDLDADHYVACAGWADSQVDDEEILGGDDCDPSRGDTFPGAAPAEIAAAACMRDADGDDYGTRTPPTGVTAGTDCDDNSVRTFPGAAERDNNPAACMRDGDEDGYGSDSAAAPVTPGADCNDADPSAFPGAPELCDGNDNDCNGSPPAVEADPDGDGWVACTPWSDTQHDNAAIRGGGDCRTADADTFPGSAPNEQAGLACMKDVDRDDWGDVIAPVGAVAGSDCDDTSASTFPGAAQLEAPLNCMKDADNDGYGDANVALPVLAGTDCNDSNATAFPGASEVPDDGIDQDCSGADTVKCFEDEDHDGFGSTTELLSADGDCTDPGESSLHTDCDDEDDDVHPGAVEIPADGIDQNCNSFDTVRCFEDLDRDRFGNDASPVRLADDGSCDTTQQEAAVAGDCADGDATSFPGTSERCDGNDNDCNGELPANETDGDNDGYVVCSGWSDPQGNNPGILGGSDCDDTRTTVSPGAAPREAAAGACMKDADGDDYGDIAPGPGVAAGTDCDDRSPNAASTFPGAAQIEAPFNCMKDSDDDGYGDAGVSLPVIRGTDCNDGEPTIFPAALERCDAIDNKCQGTVPVNETDVDHDGYVACTGWSGQTPGVLGGGDCDETSIDTFPGAALRESAVTACMRDVDGDDYGDVSPPPGVTAGTDCDDESPAGPVTFPGAAQIEAPLNCMKDADDDGYGDVAVSLPVVGGRDCDDGNAAVSPAVHEGPQGNSICADTVDNDCDGLTDAADPVCAGTSAPCPDADADGFADCATDPNCNFAGLTCGDCNDGAGSVHPDATEVCNNLDENCNGSVDEGFDADGDGFTSCDLPVADCNDGNPAVNPAAIEQCGDGVNNDCRAATPDLFDVDNDGATCNVDCNDSNHLLNLSDADDDGVTTCGGDCNDAVGSIHPGAAEVCDDEIDNDCNAATQDLFDGDGDGALCTVDCDDADATRNLRDEDEDTYSSCAGDCNDANAQIHPGVTDGCDGQDNDCDGHADEAFDVDEDGYSTCSTPPDCNDANAQIHPGLAEICHDTLDNDCDPNTPDVFDLDVDGVSCVDDCDDNDPTSRPGAPEVCDGNDNDCNASIPAQERDLDGDGYVACADWNDSQDDDDDIAGGGDCDETNAFTFPGAAERENTPSACRKDRDGDGYGDPSPPGGVIPGTDCNDASAVTFPGAAALDDPLACLKDSDGDDYGDAAVGPPEIAGTDCDDSDASAFPGAPELCDGNDNDCNGTPGAGEADPDGDGWVECAPWSDSQNDDATIHGGSDCRPDAADTFPGSAPNEHAGLACMKDADGDDFGDLVATPGVVAGSDCDDASASTFPGAAQTEGPLNCMRDRDDDGYGDASVSLPVVAGTDCNDINATIFRSAPEIPNDGIDQDCSGSDTVTCFVDEDHDGFGTTTPLPAADGDCTDPGESSLPTDCDDEDDAVHPGAVDVPGDGIDQDCSGDDTVTCFEDLDRDGFGNGARPLQPAGDGSCDTSQQEAAAAGDCADGDATSFPGASERCDGNDNDCNGALPVNETDGDNDGYVPCAGWLDTQGNNPSILGGSDCDDTRTTVSPGAAPREAAAGACMKDADGDDYGDIAPGPGVAAGTDCDDRSPSAASTFPGAAQIEAPFNCMKDADDDGYGDATASLPVVRGTDCNDGEPTVFPGAVERCDGLRNGCQGTVPANETDVDHDGYVACTGWSGHISGVLGGGDCDETSIDTFPGAASRESVPGVCRRDADGDDYGDLSPPPGVTAGTDCDDESPAGSVTFPGAAQIEAPFNCMKDADDDGYGDVAVSLPVVRGRDCDDGNAAVSPAVHEGPQGNPICSDTVDNDCDGFTDLADPVCNGTSAPCPDADADGFANCATDPNCDFAGLTCGDCNDGAGSVHPDATEVCNNLDENCNGSVDEGFDVDGDGFTSCDLPVADCNDGNPAVNPAAIEQCGDGVNNDCRAATPDVFDVDNDGATCDVDCNDANPLLNLVDADDDGVTTCGGDCNDAVGSIHPGAAEVCNDQIDNDCNAATPDLFDGDGDGALCTVDCNDDNPVLNLRDEDHDTYSSCAGDCNDGNPQIHPGATDGCDGQDNNCDGHVDEAFDLDNDGYSTCSTPPDCNDGNAQIHPGMTEVCNDGQDNDCNPGTLDLFDRDHDGVSCIADCNDDDPTSRPGAPEVCDGNDNNCNGSVPAQEIDLDGDGYVACEDWNDTQGDNLAIAGGNDCDESHADTFPGAAGSESTPTACMKDSDGDNFGDLDPPVGVVAGTDCDDDSPNAATTFPGAATEAPFNCMKDTDDDGYGDASVSLPVVPGTDCNDSSAAAHPGQVEGPGGAGVCSDALDNDCDLLVDSLDPGCAAAGSSSPPRIKWRRSRLTNAAGSPRH